MCIFDNTISYDWSIVFETYKDSILNIKVIKVLLNTW